MKKLTTYLKDKKSSLISLNEKLIINKNYNSYTCAPKSFDELRKIIEQRYKEQGAGTEQNPIDFNDIDVSNIDSFYNGTIGIFEGTRFKYIDISEWDVSSVKNMNSMFNNCEKLESIGDLLNWNVSKVEKMNSMFCYCQHLKSVGNLSNWDVSGVKDMYSMFFNCEELKSVGYLSKWDVSNVKYMYSMFYNCQQLKSAGDLSNWNVSNVKNMKLMFFSSAITNIPGWYKE